MRSEPSDAGRPRAATPTLRGVVLVGKAYGVPAYALIGGRFRDEIRCCADTPSLPDPHAMGARLAGRKQRGFTMLTMDVGIPLLWTCRGR